MCDDGKTTVLLTAFPVFAFPQRGAMAADPWKDTHPRYSRGLLWIQATLLAKA
jgi:hypothetical protein